jgi:hypothetical protein
MIHRGIADPEKAWLMLAHNVADTAATATGTIEARFRKALVVVTAIAALAMCGYLGTMLWAQNELSPPESVVAAQSLMLTHNGTLYYDLNQYPYTVCAYTPLFYLIEAGLTGLRLPVFLAGRLISFAALLGLVMLSGKLAQLYTNSGYAAWCARLFAASSSLLLTWGTVGQVDVLACCLAVAAFYQYSRFDIVEGCSLPSGLLRLSSAGVLGLLAVYTKQTTVAAPAAICVLLFARSWKKGLVFGIAWAGAVTAIALTLNVALHGRFLADTVLANMNPMSAKKLVAQLTQLGSLSGGLIVIVAVAFSRLRQSRGVALLVYLGLAAGVFAITAPKIGSDTNYQIETTVLLAVCSAVALHEIDFFRLYFTQSKSAVTLLLLPAAVHLAVGYRVAPNLALFRVAIEHAHRLEIEALRPYVPATGGLVVSTDYNAMVRLRQRLDIEPLIYTLLVSAGAVNPEPVRRDLERGAFSTVILGQDVFGAGITDLEVGTLPQSLLDEIRQHYRLAARLSVPLFGDSFVYRPAGSAPGS